MWLALDLGSTSSGAAAFDDAGRLRALSRRRFATLRPAPARVEMDAEALLRSLSSAARDVASRRSFDAVGLATQRSTVVLWDRRSGRAVAPALSWQDLRAAPHVRRLALDPAEIRSRTGLLPSAHYSAGKMRWLLDHVPQARRRAAAGRYLLGTVSAFLIFRLTRGRVFATDPTQAQRTMLFDVERGDWCPDLLSAFSIPRVALPEIRSSRGDFGLCRWGPIRACAGDQQAAFLGLSPEPGEAVINYGTGAFFMLGASERGAAPRGLLLSMLPHSRRASRRAVEGTVNAAGAAVEALGRTFRLLEDPARIPALLRTRASKTWCLPAPEGLGAPFLDPDVRTRYVGLTSRSTPGDVAFATLEGIAALVAVIARRARAAGHACRGAIATGGLSRLDALLRLQADLLGVAVSRPAIVEATLLGIAALARGRPFSTSRASRATFRPHGGPRAAARRLERWAAEVGLAID